MAAPSGLGGLLGPGSVAQQFLLWGVLQQLVGAILTPITQQILDEVYPRLTSARITPETAAELVLKGWWDMPRGTAEAEASGISSERFVNLVQNVGEPIGLQELLLAYRRGFLKWDEGKGGPPSVMEGIRQSRVRDEWGAVINELRLVPISASDAVAAVVRGQIDHTLGETIAYYNGIDAANFTILVNTYGSPPGPQELIEMVRRGIIPMTGTGPATLSLEQGIHEGDQKNKWFPVYEALTEYRPPPRTITALERAGVITPQKAMQLYTEAGLHPDLAAAYSANASSAKLTKTKLLAEGTVLNLYRAQILNHAEASTLLADLGYAQHESDWVLSWEDMHRELAAVEHAITRIANLFIARKIGAAEAGTALDALGVPASHKTELMRTWSLQRAAVVKVLTPAEVTSAFYYKVMDQNTAQAALESLGYDSYDAWVMLSVRNHAPLGSAPALGGNVTGQLP